MLNVTERAKVRLKELLEAESDDESIGLRLGKTASGALGVFPDRKRPDDQVVKHRERPCCWCDRRSRTEWRIRRSTTRRTDPVADS
jgi:hypothetical protein